MKLWLLHFENVNLENKICSALEIATILAAHYFEEHCFQLQRVSDKEKHGVSSLPVDNISWREEEKEGELERSTENDEVSELQRSSLAR